VSAQLTKIFLFVQSFSQLSHKLLGRNPPHLKCAVCAAKVLPSTVFARESQPTVRLQKWVIFAILDVRVYLWTSVGIRPE
jgi:hypothetical protein